MPEEFDERTEQATPRKRQKAKEKGQIARSRELISIAGMAGVILMFYFGGSHLMDRLSGLTEKLLGLKYGIDPLFVMMIASREALWILSPFFAMAVVFSFFAGAAQGGFLVRALNIEIERVNPISGMQRLFSRQGLFEFFKSMFKFMVFALMLYLMIKMVLPSLPSTILMDINQLRDFATKILFKVLLYSFGVFFVLAVLDYIFEKWKFERSIKMTKQELKQEMKETEGDPMVRARIKSIQREMARKRMMQEVPKATVVITNPTHIAVALKYKNGEDMAPVVVAKGTEFLAEKIKEIARRHNVPIVEDKPLARQLYKINIGAYIPVDLYKAVAKILAYIYKLKGAA